MSRTLVHSRYNVLLCFKTGRGEGATSLDGLLDVVIHAQSSPGMKVPAQLKGRLHRLAVCQVGQDTQLQLPIIRHHQGVTLGHVCCERLPHLWQVLRSQQSVVSSGGRP